MNDPTRLLDTELPEDAARLLRAANQDVQPSASSAAALLAVVAANSAATAAPTGIAKATWLRVISWGIGVSATALTVFAFVATPHTSSRLVTGPLTKQSVTSNDTMGSSDTPGVDVTTLPLVATANSDQVHLAHKIEPITLDQELARIDAARAALRAGRPAAVLTQLASYRREVATPAFADEADALEVRAQAALGNMAEARRLAERFLAKRPSSPYAERVRAAGGIAD